MGRSSLASPTHRVPGPSPSHDAGFATFCPERCVDAALREHCRIASSYRRAVDTYRIYDGTDENGIVGTVAPGLFAQEGRCWRMIFENPVGHGTHCMQLVARVGRWKFLKGWTKVWSCERHADELPWARRWG
jgi:hypothetical protein